MKIYQRELLRLNMTLSQARRKSETMPIICMMHYPPLTDICRDTGFSELMEKYQVSDVVYGHLHGIGIKTAFRGEHNGIRYQLVSCDSLDFRLHQVTE